MTNFEEKLISAVYLRSCVYDKSHPNHSKKRIVGSAWDDIAGEAGASVDTCQKRWKSLRDTFSKHSRGRTGKSGDGLDDTPVTWKWYSMLQFLSGHNLPTRTTDNFGEREVDEDNEGELLDIDQLIGPATPESGGQTSEDDKRSPSQPQKPVIKRPHQWYSEHAKENSKPSVPKQWGEVMDKCVKLMEPSTTKEQEEIDPFASYLSTEMTKMTEVEKDVMKFGVMDLLKSIKQNRRTAS